MANSYSGGNTANTGRSAAYVTVDGVDVGLCQVPLSMLPGIETDESASQFLQDTTGREEKVSDQTLPIDIILAETTLTNIKRWLGSLATIVGSTLYYGDKKGESLPTFEVKIFPLHADGHPLAGKVWTFFKCNLVPNGPLDFDPTSDGVEQLPIQVRPKKDTSQSAGQEFFSLGPAVDTVPSVSSSSPADAASGVAVDAAVTVTFNIAMGAGTLTTDAIWFEESDFSNPIKPTSITLNSDRTVLTLGHADFNASSNYVLRMSTYVASASGVKLAAPVAISFATAA